MMGGDPIPGFHVALRKWFEAIKTRDPPEIEIKPGKRSKPNYLHGNLYGKGRRG